MKIYVASSWRNDFQQDVVTELRNQGHEVYDFKNPPHGQGGFAWSDIDQDWMYWDTEAYRKALAHPIADAGFNSDFDGMKWADACVMVLPCGRSANTEAGWMKGAGKKVIVFSPIKQEPELMYKLYDGIASSFEELNILLKAKAQLVCTSIPEAIEQWKSKAEKWDDLEKKVEKYYFDEKGEELGDDEGGNLLDVGEVAARAFGLL